MSVLYTFCSLWILRTVVRSGSDVAAKLPLLFLFGFVLFLLVCLFMFFFCQADKEIGSIQQMYVCVLFFFVVCVCERIFFRICVFFRKPFLTISFEGVVRIAFGMIFID